MALWAEAPTVHMTQKLCISLALTTLSSRDFPLIGEAVLDSSY